MPSMRSEPRRPAEINIDRFVEELDARLRLEMRTTRRTSLPQFVNRVVRAIKIRSLALLQGGALVLTALAVIVAVGISPGLGGSGGNAYSPDVLAAPTVEVDSLIVAKQTILAAAFVDPVEPAETPNLIE